MVRELTDQLEKLKEELAKAQNEYDLNNIKSRALGKKSPLTEMLKKLASLPREEKPAYGKSINDFKREIERLLAEKSKEILEQQYHQTIRKEAFDLTMPGLKPEFGGLHPLTKIGRQLEDIFISLGFDIVEGPDIDDEYHNFDALNTPPDHPARNEMDTFYLKQGEANQTDNRLLLRSQTSTVQVRTMEKHKPPLKIVSIGRCYRNDKPDASHSPFFHQMEGLTIDRGITFADLRNILNSFAKKMFGSGIKSRFRPHFFPFTEPSAEFDLICFNCHGSGCNICKQSGWLEIGGAGMVDPNVFSMLGIDPEDFSGYAFGLGIDRITLLKYRIPDIRLLFENDLRMLYQFR